MMQDSPWFHGFFLRFQRFFFGGGRLGAPRQDPGLGRIGSLAVLNRWNPHILVKYWLVVWNIFYFPQ
jgi:hypothetical protein